MYRARMQARWEFNFEEICFYYFGIYFDNDLKFGNLQYFKSYILDLNYGAIIKF